MNPTQTNPAPKPEARNFVVATTDGALIKVVAIFREAKDAEQFVKTERMLPRFTHIGITVMDSKLNLWGSIEDVLTRERAEELANQSKIVRPN